MSANDKDPDVSGDQAAAPAEGDPPIIVHGQEEEEDTEASSSEGDPPIIVHGS